MAGNEKRMKKFKRIIGRTLAVIIARTRNDEFKFKQLYRRANNKIKLISVFSFKDKTSSGEYTRNDNLMCRSIENRAIFKLGFTNAHRL